ncbi:ABC transporter substrate-binding protein [Falsiroseomonas sp. CW058]|uniref:ABC transporter substrate-binding protein n=1 Tax=Falsiroseomonas sp. CW058 TaxID=3388664 RepID=UPI003D316443
MRRRITLALLAISAAFAAPAAAQRLTIGVSAVPAAVDPHFHSGTSTQNLTYNLFDTLFTLTPEMRLAPGLAVSWTPVAETMWEVRLRPGVRWTDGRPFTADDVVFTFGRAPNVPNTTGGYGGAVRSIARTEVVDPLTLRIHTHAPAPNLPVELSVLAIVSRHAGEGATTEDYNAGRAAIGTGPYRLVRYSPNDQTELVRNDAWWGPRPDFEAATIKYLSNAASRTAALLSGTVDMIDTPSPNDLPRLQSDARFAVFSRPGMRLVYLAPNQAAEVAPFVTDNEGRPLARNPLRDRRVRQALSIAINRGALADRIMQGTATPNGQWLPPGTFSHNPDVPVPAFDPEAARRLLAEAGYPAGFRIAIHISTSSRPTDPPAAQAIAQMWTRIGVQTTVEPMPFAAYAARAANLEFAMTMFGWASQVDAGYALVNVFSTYSRERLTGAFNRSGYSSPALDALTARATSTLDDTAREALLREGVRMAMEDVAVIPLYQMTNIWAARRGIAYEPSGYDYTKLVQARIAR